MSDVDTENHNKRDAQRGQQEQGNPPGSAGLRAQVLATYRELYACGLSRGTSGNVSVRCPGGMLITASGVRLSELTAHDVVFVRTDGSWAGARKPSSESHMHAAIYAARADAGAVVHCHSRYATTLACARRALPPLHYMVGVTGRAYVPCVDYATFGTEELAANVVAGLRDGDACLMANHGQIALAATAAAALAIAEELEEQAAVYWGTLQIGGPQLLDDAQMREVFNRFRGYGQRSSSAEQLSS